MSALSSIRLPNGTRDLIIQITLAGILISTFVALVVGRSIVRPIESITDVMQRLSAGEINVDIGHRDRRDEIGRMVDAIDVFRKNIIDRRAMEQTLTEAIEAISEGFSLYDAEDRIVVCNTRYKEMFSYGRDTAMAGTSFETIMTNALRHGLIPDAQSDPQRWLAERLGEAPQSERSTRPAPIGRPVDSRQRAQDRERRRGGDLRRYYRTQTARGGIGCSRASARGRARCGRRSKSDQIRLPREHVA